LDRVITALLPDFPDGDPVTIEAEPEKEGWDIIQRRMVEQVDVLLAPNDPVDFRLAIFALAPVSACLALGYYLTSRPNVRLFQYHRDEHSWAWPNDGPPPLNMGVTGLPATVLADRGEVAICFHLSASINQESLLETGKQFAGQVDIAADRPSTGWLIHPDQLKELAKLTRQVFEDCLYRFPNAGKWHIFFAGPAPAGVIIGQQLNPTMCPQVQLYEFRRDRTAAYQPSIILGGDVQ
jgi:hypothetical protein